MLRGSCCRTLLCVLLIPVALALPLSLAAEELRLDWLIQEALRNNREILAAQARTAASLERVPQAESLPDPMLMLGYQNETLSRYTYGEEQMSWWMVGLSQMFPFPGKRGLKGDMARAEAGTQESNLVAARHRVTSRVIELYYDLFLAYKNLDILENRTGLFQTIEEAALARYGSGMASQQEVLMAQTEKYMLTERKEMAGQKIPTLEGLLNLAIGRDITLPLGRPGEMQHRPLQGDLQILIQSAYKNSPDIQAKEKMIAGAEAKIKMAEKEFYPDVTVTAGMDQRGGDFNNVYRLQAQFNLPVWAQSRQAPALREAKAQALEARHDLEATKLIVASILRENYTMALTASRLMDLYQKTLMPRTRLDYESVLSAYSTGKGDVSLVLGRLKALLDFELLYWTQATEREKAMARIDAAMGGHLTTEPGPDLPPTGRIRTTEVPK